MNDFVIDEGVFLNSKLNNGLSASKDGRVCIKCAFIQSLVEAPIPLPEKWDGPALNLFYYQYATVTALISNRQPRTTRQLANYNYHLLGTLDKWEHLLMSRDFRSNRQFLEACLDELKEKKLIKTKLERIQELSAQQVTRAASVIKEEQLICTMR